MSWQTYPSATICLVRALGSGLQGAGVSAFAKVRGRGGPPDGHGYSRAILGGRVVERAGCGRTSRVQAPRGIGPRPRRSSKGERRRDHEGDRVIFTRKMGFIGRLENRHLFIWVVTSGGLARARALECQRRSKSTPLAGVKMHHLMRFSPALAVVPVVHRRDPRCFV